MNVCRTIKYNDTDHIVRHMYLKKGKHPIGLLSYFKPADETIIFTISVCKPRKKVLKRLGNSGIFQEIIEGDQFRKSKAHSLNGNNLRKHEKITVLTSPDVTVSDALCYLTAAHSNQDIKVAAKEMYYHITK